MKNAVAWILVLFLVLQGTVIWGQELYYISPSPIIRDTQVSHEFFGSVIAYRKINQQPEVSGVIVSMRAREGLHARKNAVLARVKDRVYQIQLKEARARLRQAEADQRRLMNGARPEEIDQMKHEVNMLRFKVNEYKNHFDRMEKLARKEMVSQSELEAAESAYYQSFEQLQSQEAALKILVDGSRQEVLVQAAARVDELRASMKRLQEDVIATVIRAPFTAKINEVFVHEGSYITPQTPLWELVDDRHLLVELEARTDQMRHVKPGRSIRLTFDILPDQHFMGRVSYVYPAASDQTRMVKFRAKVESRHELIKPGMFVRGELLEDTGGSRFRLPASALTERKGTRCLVRLKEGRIEFLPVTLIRLLPDGQIEVEGQLNALDRFLLDPPLDLKPGEKVDASPRT